MCLNNCRLREFAPVHLQIYISVGFAFITNSFSSDRGCLYFFSLHAISPRALTTIISWEGSERNCLTTWVSQIASIIVQGSGVPHLCNNIAIGRGACVLQLVREHIQEPAPGAVVPMMATSQNIKTDSLKCISALGRWFRRRVLAVRSLRSKKDLGIW